MKITAKTKEKPTPISVEYPLLKDEPKLEDLSREFGAEVVAAHAHASIVISAQSAMRREIGKKDFNLSDLQDKMKNWKPDVRSAVRLSAFDKAASGLDKLSAEERAELFKRYSGNAQKVHASTQKAAAPVHSR